MSGTTIELRVDYHYQVGWGAGMVGAGIVQYGETTVDYY